jgi:two-component system sensor kinase FixL
VRDELSRVWNWLRHVPSDSPQGRERADGQAASLEHAIPDGIGALLDGVPLGLLLLEADGSIAVANMSALRLLGRPDGGLHGIHVHDLLPDYRRDGSQHLVRPDGTHASIRVETNDVRLGEQHVRLLVLKDGASRSSQEKESARQRDEIAHLSRVAMLGELSGALAHELNQPLATILTNAQAAQRLLRLRGTAAPTQVLNDILADIVAEDRRAGDIIQRLRQWLRKEHPEPVALVVNDVVLDALHLVRNDLLQRGVNVQLELAGNLPAVDGDRILLQQVLLNFVLNACDAMDGLPMPHLLRVRSCASANGGVRVDVLDRGRGIAPEILPVMFEPFETTKPGGMGMGLAVCRNIVESHRGHVLARTLPEGGACVGFELPGRTS